jgi:protein TonB
MLPVSIATHVMAAVAFLIIPLAAEVELPAPMPMAPPDYMAVRSVPPPPPPAPVPGARTPAPRDVGAPIDAPSAILPERPHPPSVEAPVGPEVVGGIEGGGFTGVLGSLVVVDPPPPPVVTPPVEPIRVTRGGVIREPKKIVDVAPIYPPLARSGGVEGIVILEAVISVRGDVERLRVLRSVALLDQAATDAVQRWHYTPTLLNGVPVPVLITITVRFALR